MNEQPWQEEAIQIIHDIVPHTRLKLTDTAQTEYDKGYIFYQELVCNALPDAEKALKAFIEKLRTQAYSEGVAEGERRERERIQKRIINMVAFHDRDTPKAQGARYGLEMLLSSFAPLTPTTHNEQE
jgi:hypothetical protein